ncbi:MAG: HAD hydrolase-like protein [Bacteroidales bacterium]|jgi:3-deoxy-D-manno-octulosonate 8-phosphate phosphatase (KDO 8-P phosphatase)|nr:HAD hydrolase-like protein [Bacteroidales bacterium]
MKNFKEELKEIKALIFDVDGVLSKDYSPIDSTGEPMRTTNMKDGYAIRAALNAGFKVAIITGGISERVKLRYKKLGIEHYYDKVVNKMDCLLDFMDKSGIEKREIMYMGDDVLDYPVMAEIGVPTCPLDAAADIKAISKYISEHKSGQGCVRDIIEQVMRAQNKWFRVNE